jgi:hypothetical protein
MDKIKGKINLLKKTSPLLPTFSERLLSNLRKEKNSKNFLKKKIIILTGTLL